MVFCCKNFSDPRHSLQGLFSDGSKKFPVTKILSEHVNKVRIKANYTLFT